MATGNRKTVVVQNVQNEVRLVVLGQSGVGKSGEYVFCSKYKPYAFKKNLLIFV